MQTDRVELTIIKTVIYILIFVSVFVSDAFSWSSVDTGQAFATHQFLNTLAYEELKKHPAFVYTNFPSLPDIQRYSGMSIGVGISGLGPDVDGNSNFSDHWYNPVNNQGNAPKTIEKLHSELRKELKWFLKQTDAPPNDGVAKIAAYAAHYMQDMTCPMHVSGLDVDALKRNVPGSPGDISPYYSSYSLTDWWVLVDRFTNYRNGNSFIDFFDPLYYDGYLASPIADLFDFGSIKTGTHFQYELQVETKYHQTPSAVKKAYWDGYRDTGYLPKKYSRPKGLRQLAIESAALTRQRIGTKRNPGPLWFEKNEIYNISDELFNDKISVPFEDWWRAVRLTYALWRSAFSSLYIHEKNIRFEGITDQPNLFQLYVKVSNLEPMEGEVKDIGINFETSGSTFVEGRAVYVKGIAENKDSEWIKVGSPVYIDNAGNLSGKIFFTVNGYYPDDIPDAGVKQLSHDLSKVKIVIPEKKVEKKDIGSKKDDDDVKIDQVSDEPEKKDDGKPIVVDKDDYVIKAIAIETENVIKDNKTYSKVDDIDSAVVIIRMRGVDHIVDGYNALKILIEKGYVYSVQGVGLVTSERFTDFMVEGIDKSVLNQTDEEDDRPAFVKKTKPDNDNGEDEPSDSKPPIADSGSSNPPPSRDWQNLNDHEFVTALYDSILDRSPDEGGFNHWLQLLKSGKSRESCLSWFFKSPEYSSRKKNNSAFIIDVYQATHGRNPTQEELKKTLEELQSGISRQQIVNNRIQSYQPITLSENNEKKSPMDAKKASKPCEGVIGKWSWFNGNTVTFSANGTMGGDPKFTWSCDGTNPDRVTINWNNKWIDKLTLSKGGSRLKGKNQHGTIVWGIKM